jgi:hypothetical protein
VTAFPSKEDVILVDSTAVSESGSKRNSQGSATSPLPVRVQEAERAHDPSPDHDTGHNTPQGTSLNGGPTAAPIAADNETLKQFRGSTDTAASSSRQSESADSQPTDRSASDPSSNRGEFEGQPLRVLVAEDDPINAKILQKRLGKLHHTVRRTINGEECANAYSEQPTEWDVVLMDIQVRILYIPGW